MTEMFPFLLVSVRRQGAVLNILFRVKLNEPWGLLFLPSFLCSDFEIWTILREQQLMAKALHVSNINRVSHA